MLTFTAIPSVARRLLWIAVFLLFVAPLHGAIEIDTVNEFDAAAFCTLREAIDTANAGRDLWNGCGESNGEIRLSKYVEYQLTQPLPHIETNVTLQGDYSHLVRDKTAPAFRFFEVHSGELTLERLHLKWGSVEDKGGAVWVHPGAALTLSETKLSYNEAPMGGAIYSEGSLIIENSEFWRNQACHQGGAVAAEGGTLIVSASSFLSNEAAWETSCHSPPEATEGGALFLRNLRAFEIINSTFNSFADHGGAIYSASPAATSARISNCTLVNDMPTGDVSETTLNTHRGQVIELDSPRDKHIESKAGSVLAVNGGTVTLQHTILDGPGPLCSGTIVSAGYNVARDHSCSLKTKQGDKPSTDPQLTRLGFYGGPTQTYALDCRDHPSPAIDAYPCDECAGYTDVNDPDVPLECRDQRGQLRPQLASPLCDIGAYEAITSTSTTGGTTQVIDIHVDYTDLHDAQGIRGFVLNDGACDHDVLNPDVVRDVVWRVPQPEGDLPGVEIEEIVFVSMSCEHDCFENPNACVADCRVEPPCILDLPAGPSLGGIYRVGVDPGLCDSGEEYSGDYPYVIRFDTEIPNFSDAWDPRLRIGSSDP